MRRSEYFRQYNRQRDKKPKRIIGVDGEGITTEDGRHLYVYLAACDEDGLVSHIEDLDGLTTEQILPWLVSLPQDCLYIGFSVGYDYTKWFEQLDNFGLYHLVRPETRRRGRRITPLLIGDYKVNYIRGQLTISKEKRRVCIWDVWAFFQGTFVDACDKWGVINAAEKAQLKAMKDARPTFSLDKWSEVKDYCQLECRKLAKLGNELRQAHIDAGLPLQSYFGAGSTASALLKRMAIKEFMPHELPEGVRSAVHFAFFGGRFEIDRIGPVAGPVHSYDIASAYPYQLYQLPCLACGTWEHVTSNVRNAVERASCALVRYTLPECDSLSIKNNTSANQWGPFPMRTRGLRSEGIDDGCIVYPSSSGGGWICDQEYLTASQHWPNVEAQEAWCYTTHCGHHPFKGIGEAYCERLRWGKEGRGIVMKLGPNSCYGKLAQAVGIQPPYQCFLWALLTTGRCRAQLLRLIAQGNVVMTATDGIASTRELAPERPRDTGSAKVAESFGKEPLGAWEHKILQSGIHMIRPGIAFALSVPGSSSGIELEDMAQTKARGVGKSTLSKAKAAVLRSWDEDGPVSFKLRQTMFHGWKSCISVVQDKTTGEPVYKRHENYGLWKPRETEVRYTSEPKRPFIFSEQGSLHTWAFGKDVSSAPYERIVNAELAALRLAEVLNSEQPDRADLDDAF